jgi:hypothetical protein
VAHLNLQGSALELDGNDKHESCPEKRLTSLMVAVEMGEKFDNINVSPESCFWPD